MLRTAELDYDLPSHLVATRPAEPRDAARLMVVSRSDPSRLEHRHVRDLPGLLSPGDLLVLNTTRVLPARLVGERADTGGRVEGLYLRDGPEPRTWVLLVQGKRLRPGGRLAFRAPHGREGAELVLLDRVEGEAGAWIARVVEDTAPLLTRIGHVPLPPYIRRARLAAGDAEDASHDAERYQTVYAREGGSIAAPTAGLHFTPALLQDLAARGVERADVTLEVGVGTFRPVETEFVEDHPIHAEWCGMSQEVHGRIEPRASAGGIDEPRASASGIDEPRASASGIHEPRASASGIHVGSESRPTRVICVGTTAARTVETYAALNGCPPRVSTRLLITPGYRWRWVDGLLTNFHLPRSSLMAMVAALLPEGVPRLKSLYAEAVARGYRFYSFGDAMLVLP